MIWISFKILSLTFYISWSECHCWIFDFNLFLLVLHVKWKWTASIPRETNFVFREKKKRREKLQQCLWICPKSLFCLPGVTATKSVVIWPCAWQTVATTTAAVTASAGTGPTHGPRGLRTRLCGTPWLPSTDLTTSTPRRSAPASSPRFSKYESSRTISLYHFFRVNDVAFLPWQPYTMDRSIVGNPCPSLFFWKYWTSVVFSVVQFTLGLSWKHAMHGCTVVRSISEACSSFSLTK